MRDVYAIGIGMTRFTRHDVSSITLGEQAVAAAIRDAGIETSEIGALYAGHVHGGAVAGERVGAATGLAGLPTLNLENACASGTTAVIEATYQSEPAALTVSSLAALSRCRRSRA